jgi:diacylglycerol kinase family enzyme
VKRLLLIVNPYSTNVTGTRISRVEEVLRETVDVWTRFTERPGHATELAAEGAESGVDAIAVFSGDGTYNEALNGADGRIPFGFLPGGGTSVFARALGLPRDPVGAARQVAGALEQERSRRISFGAVNGRRFCFSAGLGFDAEAVRRIDELGRDDGGARPGDFAFGLAVARILVERRVRFEPALELTGIGRAAFLLVANGDPYSYAGRLPLRIAPDARFEDGIAFAAPERVRPGDVPRLLTAAVRGTSFGRGVHTGVDLDRLEAVCDRPMPLHVDGEDLGDVEYAVFEARRDALDCLV